MPRTTRQHSTTGSITDRSSSKQARRERAVEARPRSGARGRVRVEARARYRACVPAAPGGTIPPRRHDHVHGHRRRQRLAIDRVRQRPTQLEVRRDRVGVVEREVAGPRGRARGSRPAPRPASGRPAAGCTAPRSCRARRARTARAASVTESERTRAGRRCPDRAGVLGDGARARARRRSAFGDAERAAHDLPSGSVHASPSRSIACRGCGPPSGRFITLMKYGAGATSRNSTVRSSSARTPIAVRVVVAAAGSSPGRSPARSRSRPRSRARRGSARA